MQRRRIIMRKLFLTTFLTLGLATQALAEVRDDAKFFSDAAVTKANDATQTLKRSTGKELLVETYPAIPAEKAADYSPQNKNAFFDKWANDRFQQAHVNGVYIL